MKYLLSPDDYSRLNSTEFQWEPMKVIMLNFSGIDVDSWEIFKSKVSKEMINQFTKLDIKSSSDYYDKFNYKELELGEVLEYQIAEMKRNNRNNIFPKVVLLIDEYDHPYRSFATNRVQNDTQQEFKKKLKTFYENIKRLCEMATLHKVFLTGILRLAQTSIFSGNTFTENNLIIYRRKSI